MWRVVRYEPGAFPSFARKFCESGGSYRFVIVHGAEPNYPLIPEWIVEVAQRRPRQGTYQKGNSESDPFTGD